MEDSRAAHADDCAHHVNEQRHYLNHEWISLELTSRHIIEINVRLVENGFQLQEIEFRGVDQVLEL